MLKEKTVYTTEQDIDRLRHELAYAATDEYKKAQKVQAKKRIISMIIYMVIIACLLGTLTQLIYAKRTGAAPSLFNYYIFRIETPSMDPTLPVGSLIISKAPEDPEKLKVGDIVTFISTQGDRITHAVVEVIPPTDECPTTTYRTKGDNPQNSIDIEVLTPDRIEAVFVFKVPLF